MDTSKLGHDSVVVGWRPTVLEISEEIHQSERLEVGLKPSVPFNPVFLMGTNFL